MMRVLVQIHVIHQQDALWQHAENDGNCFFCFSTLEIIFCAFCRKLFREGTYLVVYPG